MEPIAQLRGVRKRYATTEALKGVDLTVTPGRLVALLGPNGAGKTTAISLLCGLRRPDDGTAELFGADPRQPATRRFLGVTPQDTGFPEQLKVAEIVNLGRGCSSSAGPRCSWQPRSGCTGATKACATGKWSGAPHGPQKRQGPVAAGWLRSTASWTAGRTDSAASA